MSAIKAKQVEPIYEQRLANFFLRHKTINTLGFVGYA